MAAAPLLPPREVARAAAPAAPPVALEERAGALPDGDVLDALLSLQSPEQSAAAATGAALALWQLQGAAPGAPSLEAIAQALRAAGCTSLALEGGDLSQLRQLELPALLALEGPDASPRFALLRRLQGGRADLEGLVAGQSVRVPEALLVRHWRGAGLVAWRDFAGLPDALAPGDSGPAVAWVQDALARLAYYAGASHGRYDADTRAAVEAFQRGAGIEVDGRIGPRTKLALYRALPDYSLPQLATSAGTPPSAGS